MPKEHKTDFLFESYKASKSDMSGWVQELIRASSRAEPGDTKELAGVCQLILVGVKEPNVKKYDRFGVSLPIQTSFKDDLLGTVMEADIHLHDPELCKTALQAVMDELPQPATLKTISCFGLPEMQSR